MVAAGEEGDTHFPRVVRLRLRDLAGDEGIGTGGDGRFEITLRAARAPGDVADRAVRRVEQGDRFAERLLDVGGQRLRAREALAVVARAQEADLLFAEAPGRAGVRHQAQLEAELRVVAEFRMRIERQVIGEQAYVVAEQEAEPLLHPAGHAPVLAAPEQAVVHEDRIGLGKDRSLDQRAARGHARDDLAHRGAAFDLQAVRAVVLEALGREQEIERMQEFVAGRTHRAIVDPSGAGRLAPRAPGAPGQGRRHQGFHHMDGNSPNH
jgi:hypothetical protein